MAEKVVIHAGYALSRKHLLVTLARAKQLQENGDDVTLTYCAANRGVCAVNHIGNPALCAVCKANVRGSAKSAGVPAIPLMDPPEGERDRPPQPTFRERRRLLEGVLSDLVSRLRVLTPDLKSCRLFCAIMRRYYATVVPRLEAFSHVLAAERPNRVEVFNGRVACSKFAIVAAERHDIPFSTLETNGRQPVVFKGHTPHDRVAVQDRILRQRVDFAVAEEFYRQRKSPKHSCFAKRLKGGFTPPRADNYRRKISFFLSSQDEFESLGPEWKSKFDDYAGVVEAACRRFPNDFFAVRFHPNQREIISDVVSPFTRVGKLTNTVIYPPESTVDSYSLIEWSDVVVTFGTTITVEACWAGKPTVLLGPAFFDRLDIAVTPATIEEFLETLRGEVPVSDRANAARVAVYFRESYDSLPHLEGEGNKIRPVGFRLSRPYATSVARLGEKILCRALRFWGRRALASEAVKAPVPEASGTRPHRRRAA